jgi:hypothetical protein
MSAILVATSPQGSRPARKHYRRVHYARVHEGASPSMPDTMLGSLALIDFKAFNRKGTEYLYCTS